MKRIRFSSENPPWKRIWITNSAFISIPSFRKKSPRASHPAKHASRRCSNSEAAKPLKKNAVMPIVSRFLKPCSPI
jgi:hypothetical protein